MLSVRAALGTEGGHRRCACGAAPPGTSNSLMDMGTGKLTELGLLFLSPSPADSSTPSGPGAEGAVAEAEEWEGWAGPDAWSERCGLCVAHVERWGSLSALPPEQAVHCRNSCGLVERRDPAPGVAASS